MMEKVSFKVKKRAHCTETENKLFQIQWLELAIALGCVH